MKLSLTRPFLSIQAFPEATIPSFTLITGINGVGKTHLLKGVAEGHVATDAAPTPQQDARYFDWNTLVPNNAGTQSSLDLYNEREQLFDIASQIRVNHKGQLEQLVQANGLSGKWTKDLWGLLRLTQNEVATLVGNEEKGAAIFQLLKSLAKDLTRRLTKQLRRNPHLAHMADLLSKDHGDLVALIQREQADEAIPNWGHVDLFQQSFARMFLAYFEARKLNRLIRLDNDEGRTGTRPLSEEQFEARHGGPPWVFINDILREASLDFEIDHPKGYTTTNYKPRLTKIGTNVEVEFGDLSSGEKILMSFAFCLYYSTDRRQTARRPKVLLLDEIDAPMHPSMSRRIVSTITETLVEKEGVNVILATHSPSTVAVAPESSIYVMEGNGQGLKKVGRRQAIALLTKEIPTLSISFHGRRQVFVESRHDAERYDLLYRKLSSRIASERSLVFIGSGRLTEGGAEKGANCDRVKQLVKALANGGNESVWGLIDWDGKNQPEGRVHVLAFEKRDSIENCLLDPLLVAAIVARENRDDGVQIGLGKDDVASNLRTFERPKLQGVVDAVQRRVLKLDTSAPLPDCVEARYNGLSLNLSNKYLHMDGHELEGAVKAAFPSLQRFHNTGELLLNITEPILAEFPEFVPDDLFLSIQGLVLSEGD